MYPCVLFALRREAQPFYRHYPVRRRLTNAPCAAWLCGTSLERVLVLETGVGGERCEAALHWLRESSFPGKGLLQPLFLVAAGFAGALEPGWHIGEVLVASEVVEPRGRTWPRDPLADPLNGAKWREGRLLSVSRMIGDPAEKQRLGQRFAAAAVDMESAAAARFCAQRGIPFASVRAISDEVQTRLSPRLVSLLGGSGVRVASVLATLVRAPGMALELWRLARDTRRAAQRLARALVQLLGENGTVSAACGRSHHAPRDGAPSRGA